MHPQERTMLIEQIRQLPAQLEAVVKPLSPRQLTTHFLPNEWTVAQNIHHLADSHMNSFIRLKFILTEDTFTIQPYNQAVWAETIDSNNPLIQDSLNVLKGLHPRWVFLFESLNEAQWRRKALHPEIGTVSVEDILRIYGGHGLGHIDQIQRTLAAAG